MLDVNAELSGPVEDQLQPFDAEVNFEFTARFLERWGVELSDEDLHAMIELLTGFDCGE